MCPTNEFGFDVPESGESIAIRTGLKTPEKETPPHKAEQPTKRELKKAKEDLGTIPLPKNPRLVYRMIEIASHKENNAKSPAEKARLLAVLDRLKKHFHTLQQGVPAVHYTAHDQAAEKLAEQATAKRLAPRVRSFRSE